MNHSSFYFSILLMLSSCYCQAQQNPTNQGNIDVVYSMALRGELKKVFEVLDTINVSSLDSSSQATFQKYYARFITLDETYDFNTDDRDIISLVNLFHNYWNSVLLDKITLNYADSLFKKNISSFLYTKFYKSNGVNLDSISSDLYFYSNDYLKQKGYYSNAFGKTAHLYDLFLWQNQEKERYSVELLEDTIEVNVTFLKNFISQGWTHYATLGKRYASGWATKEGLYAVNDAYDRSSEDFEVSYIIHEGQHFADYKRFPYLDQKELEYRAKLMELYKSKKNTLRLIGKFISNAVDDSKNAHSAANYSIINHLSNLIFNESFVTEKEKWQSIEPDVIRNKSIELLTRHNRMLVNKSH